MDAVNPLYIARNHLVDAALSAADTGDLTAFNALLAAVSQPYTEQPDREAYAHGAPAGSPRHVTFCGT